MPTLWNFAHINYDNKCKKCWGWGKKHSSQPQYMSMRSKRSLCVPLPGSGLELSEGRVWAPSYIGLCTRPRHSGSYPDPQPRLLPPWSPCLWSQGLELTLHGTAVVGSAQNLAWLPSALRIKCPSLRRTLYDLTLVVLLTNTATHPNTHPLSRAPDFADSTSFKFLLLPQGLCTLFPLPEGPPAGRARLPSAHPSGLTLDSAGLTLDPAGLTGPFSKKSSLTSHGLLGFLHPSPDHSGQLLSGDRSVCSRDHEPCEDRAVSLASASIGPDTERGPQSTVNS